MGVGAGEIEVERIGESFGEEVAAGGERFQVEELIFDQAMDGFDVALEGVSGGRDADVLAVAESGGEPVRWPLRSKLPTNSEPLSVCQTRSRRETPQRSRCC